MLVSRALQGTKRRYGVPTVRKLPLIRNNLITIFTAYQPNPSHDDLLFTSQVLTGFDYLMHLGELKWPDAVHLHDYCKVTMQHSVEFLVNTASIWLPGHKADQYFKGNWLIIRQGPFPDTYTCSHDYLSSRNLLFHLRPKHWLRADGTIPT